MQDSIDYALTLEDFAAFSAWAVMRRNRGRASFGAVGPVLGGAVGLTALFTAWNLLSGVEMPVALLGPAVIFLPVAVLFVVVFRPTYRAQLKAMLANMAEEEREELLGPKTLSWDDAGLTQLGEAGSWHLAWHAITAVEETETHLFLMAGGLNGLFIPKRALAPEALGALTAAVTAATGLSPVRVRP